MSEEFEAPAHEAAMYAEPLPGESLTEDDEADEAVEAASEEVPELDSSEEPEDEAPEVESRAESVETAEEPQQGETTAEATEDSAPGLSPIPRWRRWLRRRGSASESEPDPANSDPAPADSEVVTAEEPKSEGPSSPVDATDAPAAGSAAKKPVGKRQREIRRPVAAAEPPAPQTAEAPMAEDLGPEPVAVVKRRPIPKPVTAVAAVAAALFVAAAAYAAAMLQPYLADRAVADTKIEIARTAANAITSLWTYTPDDMENLPDRSAQYLGGDLQDQYRSFITAIAPSNKQAQITNSTQVMGAAVESLQGNAATAVVYTNTVSTSPTTNNIPSLKYMSYHLDLERRGSDWLVTRMTPITTLDITPRLG